MSLCITMVLKNSNNHLKPVRFLSILSWNPSALWTFWNAQNWLLFGAFLKYPDPATLWIRISVKCPDANSLNLRSSVQMTGPGSSSNLECSGFQEPEVLLPYAVSSERNRRVFKETSKTPLAGSLRRCKHKLPHPRPPCSPSPDQTLISRSWILCCTFTFIFSLLAFLCTRRFSIPEEGAREGAREGDGNDDTPETPRETETERKRKIWRKLRPVGMMTLWRRKPTASTSLRLLWRARRYVSMYVPMCVCRVRKNTVYQSLACFWPPSPKIPFSNFHRLSSSSSCSCRSYANFFPGA